MLARIEGSPAQCAANLSLKECLLVFRGFKHRWTDGEDMGRLWHACGELISRHGSLGAFVQSIDDGRDNTIERTMVSFAGEFNRIAGSAKPFGLRGKKQAPLLPSPADGSACKRLALYFRWMVRGTDGIDLGVWNFISPSRLIIPLDRHISRMGRNLRLTTRHTNDWKTALEITRALRHLDPEDPLRYDFALVRPGILGMCPTRCSSCPLGAVCRELNSPPRFPSLSKK